MYECMYVLQLKLIFSYENICTDLFQIIYKLINDLSYRDKIFPTFQYLIFKILTLTSFIFCSNHNNPILIKFKYIYSAQQYLHQL
jgi:hypothetical protein